VTARVCLEPLTVADRCPANGSPAPEAARTVDASASLSVAVVVEGRPWGRLLVSDTEPRQFTPAEVVFVQAIAAVLAAAVELDRVQTGRDALASFGRFALECPETTSTIERAVDVVTQLVQAPVGALLRVSQRPGTLTIVQVSGPVGLDTGDEYEVDPTLVEALRGPEPLVVDDWRVDERFATPLLPHAVQSISGLAAAVVVDGRIWGRLMVADTRPRRFSEADVDIISSAADMLAAALQRKRLEWSQAGAARVSAAREQTSGPVTTTEVALVDLDGVIVWVNRAWEDFCRDNGGDPARTGVGMSYVECCDAAGDPLSRQVGHALRAALRGELPAPMTMLVPCHSPQTHRWFDLLISSRLDDSGTCLGAAVTLSLADR